MENKRVYLYRITNRVNGLVYIGSSVSPAARFAVYRCKCHNNHLRRSFEKYGLAHFDFDVIACVLDPRGRDMAEADCIAAHNACDPAFGYNQIAGGRASEWSEARKTAAKGRPSPNKGHKMTADARARISEAQKGKPKSAEHNRKNSEGVKAARARKYWSSRTQVFSNAS